MELADDLGVALQLTNILRDVVEDRGNGRVYLPAADAIAVGCPPDLSGSEAALAELVAFECARAHEWFERGLQLLPLLDRRSRACVGAMAGIYYRLLVHIERDPHAVTQGRLSLPAAEKVWIAGKCHRWGAAMTARRVVVVGGGLAGVSAALSLADAGARGHAARAAAEAGRSDLVIPTQWPLVRQRPTRVLAMLYGLPALPRPHRCA